MAPRSLTCYAQPEKPKSRRVLEAFAAGAAAWAERVSMASTTAAALAPGDAAFYGVRPGWRHLWQQAEAESTWRERFYLDNAWFDAGREHYFRVGVNALQSWSQAESDGARARALGLTARAGRRGACVLICAQSDEFLRSNAGWSEGLPGWLAWVEREIRAHTDRLIVVRTKATAGDFAAALRGAWVVVTHASAAAHEALLAGVPVIVTDAESAAASLSVPFEAIEDAEPEDPALVQAWANRLADSQWTLDELRQGAAWRTIHNA